MTKPENWTMTYDRIEDSYIPGDTLPPVKNEWRFRYERYIWKTVLVTKDGRNAKRLESQFRPVFNGCAFGVYNSNDEQWLFLPIDQFKSITVNKYRIKANYRLVSANDDGVTIEFREEEPAPVRDVGAW